MNGDLIYIKRFRITQHWNNCQRTPAKNWALWYTKYSGSHSIQITFWGFVTFISIPRIR